MMPTGFYFKNEVTRLIKKPGWKSIVMLVMFCISLFLIQLGIFEYNDTKEKNVFFQKTEQLRIAQYFNYRQYGTLGIQFALAPAEQEIFFTDSGFVPDLVSSMSSGYVLTIFQIFKGENIFKTKKSGFFDFSGFLLIFGTLFAMFLGLELFKNEDYLKFYSSLIKEWKVFRGLIMARMVILLIYLVLLFGTALILILLNGLVITSGTEIFFFMTLLYITWIFFFFLGTLFGFIKSRSSAIPAMISCWFLLIFIVPVILDSYIAHQSGSIASVYKHDLDKLKIVTDFEKMATNKAGVLNLNQKPAEIDKKMITDYLKSELDKIMAIEKKMCAQIESVANRYHALSVFTPATFYRSTTSEISSRGYNNLVNFYKYLQKVKEQFARYILEKAYFSDKPGIESFIKGNANIYYASSILPSTFIPGFLILIFQLLLILFISFILFKRRVYCEPAKPINPKDTRTLSLNTEPYTVVHYHYHDFKRRLYNILSGKQTPKTIADFSGRVFIHDKDLVQLTGKTNFFYLCPPCNVPGDITVKNFILMISGLAKCSAADTGKLLNHPRILPLSGKRFDQLEYFEKSEIFLHLVDLKKCDFYIIDDIGKDMPGNYFVQLSQKLIDLKKSGAVVVYFSTYSMPESSHWEINFDFSVPLFWHQKIEAYAEELKKNHNILPEDR